MIDDPSTPNGANGDHGHSDGKKSGGTPPPQSGSSASGGGMDPETMRRFAETFQTLAGNIAEHAKMQQIALDKLDILLAVNGRGPWEKLAESQELHHCVAKVFCTLVRKALEDNRQAVARQRENAGLQSEKKSAAKTNGNGAEAGTLLQSLFGAFLDDPLWLEQMGDPLMKIGESVKHVHELSGKVNAILERMETARDGANGNGTAARKVKTATKAKGAQKAKKKSK